MSTGVGIGSRNASNAERQGSFSSQQTGVLSLFAPATLRTRGSRSSTRKKGDGTCSSRPTARPACEEWQA
eukprot:4850500-Pleurochrysis_carterae.AAC.5